MLTLVPFGSTCDGDEHLENWDYIFFTDTVIRKQAQPGAICLKRLSLLTCLTRNVPLYRALSGQNISKNQVMKGGSSNTFHGSRRYLKSE